MVAAPESVQAPPPAVPFVKVASPAGSNGVYASPQAVENGVDALTVADATSTSADASAKASSDRTHNDNFDPTSPAAIANLPPIEISRQIPCRFFPAGTCKYGDQCAFSHAGVAGVAPVAADPQQLQQQVSEIQNVQHQQQQHPMQHQLQQDEYMHDSNGMPMYYPPQMSEHDQYGAYQQQFSPQQQGYYPFPPPFQHYAQHYAPPPQQYFQHIPPPPQQMQMQQSEVPSASPTPSTVAIPTEQGQDAASPSALSPPATSPFPSPNLPLGGPQPYPTYAPQVFGQEYYAATSPPTAPTTFGPDGLPLRQDRAQSLHTFFQTGAPPPLPLQQQQQQQQQQQPNAFPKGSIPPPRALIANRRLGPPSTSAVPSLPFKNGPRPRFNSLDGPHALARSRPPCSFFEANRCRNRDECPFVHVMPDGSDARFLRQGLVGVDGRTENPEERGGIPPAWIANPKPFVRSGGNHQYMNGGNGMQGMQRGSMNGGYSLREPKPKSRFEEEQQRVRIESGEESLGEMEQLRRQSSDATATNANAVAAKAAAVAAANGGLAYPLPAVPVTRAANGTSRPNFGAGGAPALVDAINGLTRRIPPVNSSVAASTLTATTAAAAAPSQRNQRVPSGADFPALSSAEHTSPTASPVSTPLAEVAPAPVAAAPVAAAEPWSPSAGRDGAPATEPAQIPATLPPTLARSDSSDSDFVIITHEEATPAVIVPAAVAPVVVVAPAPRIMGSFASAAARGAAVVLPEKARKVVVPVVAPVAAVEEGVVVKEVKKKERKNKGRATEVKVAPVVVSSPTAVVA